MIWKQRNFLSSRDTPHKEETSEFLEAVQQTKEISGNKAHISEAKGVTPSINRYARKLPLFIVLLSVLKGFLSDFMNPYLHKNY